MPRPLSSKLANLPVSGIRRFTALAAATPGCISLAIGEPGETTAPHIRAAVTEELAAGNTHYPPNAGFAYLREAVAAWEGARGIPADPERIFATVGATEAIAASFATVLDPGDEVVLFSPLYLGYQQLAALFGARTVVVDTAGTGFQISRAALEEAVTPRTKLVVVTSPNNPTGCVYTPESLTIVAEAARAHDLYVLADDIYAELVYVPGFTRFAAAHPELADRTFVVNGFSKSWAMTGWRLGWLIAPPAAAPEVAKVHQSLVSSVPAFLQKAAVAALKTPTHDMRAAYLRRRALVCDALAAMGVACAPLCGAFYALIDIAPFGISSEEFCLRAIGQAGVALVPGSCFSAEGHARLSYACEDAVLVEGLDRLARFVDSLR